MPTLGPLLELGIVQPLNAAKAWAEGKDTHLLAQEVQDLKGFIPGSNAWYAKAAFDHMILQKILESLSPGYLTTIRNRTMRDFSQDWYWRPGETLPERLPDFGKVLER